ncbi:glucose dehydrogenase [FAD, quinone]-like [Ochlerotatus camptorhynchus]|uniref:glucose dehydrogenase [FAD, quinone]-like n=1 Tax=Ochlerotatus camptorhynchus TaxID=644619 RepID=UPI0031D11626
MIYELQRTNIDWEYKAMRSRRHSISSVNGVSWPRGLALGGSGTIGAMKYERGNRRDYDRWEQQGNVGWGWDNVLKYFKKSENSKVMRKSKLHNTGGYLSVDNYDIKDPINTVLQMAAKEVGFVELKELNGNRNVGIGRAQFMIENGTRCSPAKAFLNPVKHRTNLHIIKHAFVTSISFSKENVAQGVNLILRNMHSLRAIAKREVILSTGVINTAKLLMLSGIGRQTDLAPLRILQRADLNVGYNLQDHVAIPLFYKFNKSSQTIINLTLEKVLNIFDYVLKNNSQPLTNHDMSSLTLNVNTVNATEPYPDVQVGYRLFKKGGITSYSVMQKMGYDWEIVESIHRAEQKADVVLALIGVLNPKSKGTIKLADGDPYSDPIIKPAYFSQYDDLKTIIRAIRIHQQMLTTATFRKNEAQLHQLNIPACAFIQYDTDEYWECYIRHMSTSMYHPAGTAKMGPDDDPEAVVTPQLKVRHIGNLRIIDASVMPQIVSGGLMAPTIMIGEKGADLLKEDHSM